jgi:hypothetical protein
MSWGWAINFITIENFDVFIPLGSFTIFNFKE